MKHANQNRGKSKVSDLPIICDCGGVYEIDDMHPFIRYYVANTPKFPL